MKIDFVVLWVDNSDLNWMRKKDKFSGNYLNQELNAEERYRDYDDLKYWFRAVDQYADWVNHVFLVTDGQCPDWLDTEQSKVSVVDHKDFLKAENLPVFNSNAIELNIDNISELSEHFVLFNDDMFINDVVSEKDFFSGGLPRDIGLLNPIIPEEGGIGNTINNNMELINRDYSMRECLKENLGKFLNVKYGIDNIRTLALMLWHKFPGFYNPHLPVSYTKSEFRDVRKVAADQFEKTSANKFRTSDDISHWLIRYTRLAQGNFAPISPEIGHIYSLSDTDKVISDIVNSTHKLLCINDDNKTENFSEVISKINQTLDVKLRNKSTYEK
ncbi:Stealth CR1 domain-containing protein [Lactiplantibacillus paraxiangfangensis]|uniref:Stealth CR1 domain-containing protein n=1 Tax=Lactiplantibacillus paraxiangfangensis TaxID=3076224 RepID=UPI0030C72BD8